MDEKAGGRDTVSNHTEGNATGILHETAVGGNFIETMSNLVCKNTPGMFPTKTMKGRAASMSKKPIPKKKESVKKLAGRSSESASFSHQPRWRMEFPPQCYRWRIQWIPLEKEGKLWKKLPTATASTRCVEDQPGPSRKHAFHEISDTDEEDSPSFGKQSKVDLHHGQHGQGKAQSNTPCCMPGLFYDEPDSTNNEEREIGSDEEREIGSDEEREIHVGSDEEREIHVGSDEEREVGSDEEREVHVGSDEEREIHVGSDEEREVHVGSDEEREIGSDEEREVHVGSDEEREIHVGSDEEREVHVGSDEEREIHVGSDEEREIHVGSDEEREIGSDEEREVGSDEERKVGSDEEREVGSDEEREVGSDEEREVGSDEEREVGSDEEGNAAQQQQADPEFQQMVGATGPDVQSELAHIVNDAMSSVIPDEKMKAIAEQMCRPANCTRLVVPTANPEIWNSVNAKLKSKDLALQKTQSLVLNPFASEAV